MRAKSGYKDQKPGPERWDSRRKAYTTVGRALHRYFLLRTVRKNRQPSEEEANNECDGTCPLCWPPEATEAELLERLRRALER